MRTVFSLGGLLLALFLVSKLFSTQLTALTGVTSAAPGADAASAVPRASAADRAAAQVTQAISQGAAQRADDAASR
jgi:hypothetical protein